VLTAADEEVAHQTSAAQSEESDPGWRRPAQLVSQERREGPRADLDDSLTGLEETTRISEEERQPYQPSSGDSDSDGDAAGAQENRQREHSRRFAGDGETEREAGLQRRADTQSSKQPCAAEEHEDVVEVPLVGEVGPRKHEQAAADSDTQSHRRRARLAGHDGFTSVEEPG
jgi:hypothetical protein